MEEEIDLRELLDVLRQRSRVILSITLIAVLVSAGLSYFVIAPSYRTSTTLIVMKSSDQSSVNLNDLTLGTRLASTYSKVATSHRVLDKVIKDLKLGTTYNQLAGQISVQPVGNTQLIRISVTGGSPQQVQAIANATAKAFMTTMPQIIKVDNISVVDSAPLPTSPVSPRKKLNVMIALVLGLMLGTFAAFVLEFLDTYFRTRDDVERELELPVIGMIPEIKPQSTGHGGN